ncbi:MAG: T9SS type A sorting domain-containing protein [candidate division WOR-3 bacterium]
MVKYFILFLSLSGLIFAQNLVLPPYREPGRGITSENKEVSEIVIPEIKEPVGFSNSLEGYIPAREVPCEIEPQVEIVNQEVPSILNWGTDVAIDTSYIASYDVDYDTQTGYLYAAVAPMLDSVVRIYRSTDNGRHWTYIGWMGHTPRSIYWNVGLIVARGDSNFIYVFMKHSRNNGEIYLYRWTFDFSQWTHYAVATGADTIDEFSVCRDYRSNYGLYCEWQNENRGGINARLHRSFTYGRTWDSQLGGNVIDAHISFGATSYLLLTWTTPDRNGVYFQDNRSYGDPLSWRNFYNVSFDTFNHYRPRVASVLTTPDSQATTWVLYEYNWRNTGDYDVWYAIRSHAWADTWRRAYGLSVRTTHDEFAPDIKHFKSLNYPWVCATYMAADSGWDDSVNVYWTYTNKDTPTVWRSRTRVNDSLWNEAGYLGPKIIWDPTGGMGAVVFCRGGFFLFPHGLYMDAVIFTDIADKNLNKATGLRISSNPAIGQVRFYPNPETKSLKIYDLSGKLIKSFTNPKTSILWNGRDEKGKMVNSGIYIIKAKTEQGERSEKLLFLR